MNDNQSEYKMAEEVRSYNILLEEMRGHFQLVTEGLCALVEKVDGLDRKVEGLEHRMDQFELAMLQYNLEMKRHNHVMETLRKDVNHHDDDIVTLKTAVGIKI